MSKKLRENSSKTGTRKSAAAVKKAALKKVSTAKSGSKTRKSAAKLPKAAATIAKKTVKKTARKAAVSKTPMKPKTTTKVTKEKAPTSTVGKGAVEGAKAPDFRLPRDGGKTVSLADYAGRKLVVFFYPRANTPGCTREAIDFTRLSGDFAAAKTAVLGVSADPLKAQNAFRDKHDLKTPLASDEGHSMLEAYGAWGEKSMYGKTFEGVLRTTILIGDDGRIARIWRSVKVDGHAEAVLEAARAT